MTIDIGDPAPDFTLPGDDGTAISLSGFRGRPVVVYFYPKDNTAGCTREAEAFRDAYAAFKAEGAEIIGISRDGVRSHQRFRDKLGLPFPLLVDEDGAAAEAYGVWKQKSMYGRTYMGIERSTFLVGPDGRIRGAWRKVKVPGHADQVLKALEALNGER